jgi:hypothetical protein
LLALIKDCQSDANQWIVDWACTVERITVPLTSPIIEPFLLRPSHSEYSARITSRKFDTALFANQGSPTSVPALSGSTPLLPTANAPKTVPFEEIVAMLVDTTEEKEYLDQITHYLR